MAANARHVVLVACIPVIVALLSYAGVLRHARDGVSDLLFGSQVTPENITIIAIDEASIQHVGQWPWPRSVMASAIARLSSARAIGIDVNYKEPSRLGSADDSALAKAMRSSTAPVVLASELQSDGSVSNPIPVLASASTQGFANVSVDPDGIIRTARISRGGILSLAARLAQTAGYRIPARETGLISYAGPAQTFRSYPFTELTAGQVPDAALTGHIVIIGATARDLQDYRQTPVGLMSGVEVQATILENVISDAFLGSNHLVDALLTLLAGLAGCLIAFRLHRVWVMVSAVTLLMALVWLGIFIAFDSGFLLDLLMPTIAIIAGAGATVLVRWSATTRERRFIHDTFSHYLAPQVVATLLQDPSRVRLGGERRDLTILFSDIRGFTTLSETMGPQELAQFMNRYLSVMTDLILDRSGVIDKYIGDAIMAFWGAPLDDDASALHGVQAALAMVDALAKFNKASTALGLASIKIGIGLNSGAVTVGNMGSEKRFDYTVIGDEVNLASRLEGLTKTYGVNIIVSGNVLERIGESDLAQHRIQTREIDRVRVKGKTKPVVIYQVIPQEVAEHLAPHRALFDRGLSQYYAGQWQEAIASLDAFLAVVEADGPATVLQERCHGFLHRPAPDWDGVFEMTHK